MSTFITNRKARFDFDILDTIEAGVVLHGFEVKSLRNGRGKIEGAFVQIRGNEAYLVGASIPAYQPANTPKGYEPERIRKLLLNRKELEKIQQQTEKERLTAVPLALYSAGRNIKLEVAIARGKRKHDKRESIKERDTKRDIERTLKTQ
jgi:SsrA-binding protein